MSAKNKDRHGRWRSRTVSFRASEDEIRAIDEAVSLSGLSKQEYIITKLLNRNVVVVGNPRVYSALRSKMVNVCNELMRLSSGNDVSDGLMETITLLCKIYSEMNNNKKREDYD